MNLLLQNGHNTVTIPVLSFEGHESFGFNHNIVTTHSITVSQNDYEQVLDTLVDMKIQSFASISDSSVILINLDSIDYRLEVPSEKAPVFTLLEMISVIQKQSQNPLMFGPMFLK